MKFQVGKTYKTRGGGEAVVLVVNAPTACGSYAQPIVGWYKNEIGGYAVASWCVNGLYIGTTEHDADLIPEPEESKK